MKSFLNEIEKKFTEINEHPIQEEHNCEIAHPGLTHEEYVQNEMITTDDEEIALDLDAKGKDVKLVKEDDIDEAHCNTKQEDIDEMSTTAGVAPFQTPYAFSTKAQAKKKKKMKYESVQAAMDKKYAAIIESYSKFAKKLQEIEQLVRYTSKLKTESGIAGSTYGKSTHNALNKISQRLLKISERVRSLGE